MWRSETPSARLSSPCRSTGSSWRPGGNRDFNSIHHNRSYATATNAPDAYASTFFLMGA